MAIKTHPGVMISSNLIKALKPTGGVYCIQPTNFTHKYKFGRAKSLPKHLDGYCLCYPTGFYVVGLWTGLSIDETWAVESRMFAELNDLGHSRMAPACGIRKKNTEWIQMEANTTIEEHETLIQTAFNNVRSGYKKGKVILY